MSIISKSGLYPLIDGPLVQSARFLASCYYIFNNNDICVIHAYVLRKYPLIKKKKQNYFKKQSEYMTKYSASWRVLLQFVFVLIIYIRNFLDYYS